MGIKDLDLELLQEYLTKDTKYGRIARAARFLGHHEDIVRYAIRYKMIEVKSPPIKDQSDVQKDYIAKIRAETGLTPKMHRRNKDPRVYLVEHAKARASRFDMEFDLVHSDIVVPDLCPVLGIPIVLNRSGGCHDNSPSIDRIDNDRGYVWDNVIVVSGKANRIKNDATVQQLQQVAHFYTNLKVPATRPLYEDRPKRQYVRLLTPEQESQVAELVKEGLTHREVALRYGVSDRLVGIIAAGRPKRPPVKRKRSLTKSPH